MNVDLAVLADYAVVSSENKLMICGLFDRLRVPELPWSHPSMAIALRLHVHPGEAPAHDVKVRLVDPDGSEIVALDGKMTLGEIDPLDGAGSQVILSLNGVPFTKEGRHAFDIFLDGRYEATIPLTIKIVAPRTDDKS